MVLNAIAYLRVGQSKSRNQL